MLFFGINCSNVGTVNTKKQQLKDAGISHQDASRCEKIASISEDEFEAVINEAKKNNKPVTYQQVEKNSGGRPSGNSSNAGLVITKEKQLKSAGIKPSEN